jgi:hypothetical protein
MVLSRQSRILSGNEIIHNLTSFEQVFNFLVSRPSLQAIHTLDRQYIK